MSRRRGNICGALAILGVCLTACGRPSSGSAQSASGSETAAAPSDSPGVHEGAAKATAGGEAAGPGTVKLEGPRLTSWSQQFQAGSAASGTDDGYSHRGTVTRPELPLYARPGDKWPIGTARIGTELPAKPASGRGCSGGAWYMVTGNGHACTSDGFDVHPVSAGTKTRVSASDRARSADLSQPSPFKYAKVRKNGLPRLNRLPKEDEVAGLAELVERGAGGGGPLVSEWLSGTYLVALGQKTTVGGQDFYQSTDGKFLRAADLEDRPTPPMHGERLDKGEFSLPLAFAHEESKLLCAEGDSLRPCGEVKKHARFHVEGRVEHEGKTYLRGPGGTAVLRAKVRLAERQDRPGGIPAGAKWIHVNLSQQTLVAYEGDEPIFTTLVSSGLPTHATPTGLWRTERKYNTKTMRGKDDDGPYEVQEVPWTMFYHGNYAIHGAYWHNRFGKTKSHGCTNVPPIDARWLYHWGDLELPQGWHEMYHRRGTYFYFTGKTPPEMPE